MSFNTFGKLFRFTTWGESHGPAIGCVVDGCPPRIRISEKDIQKELNKRKPGQSKFTTQRKEDDKVEILSGVFNGETTGTPILMIIYNKDMKSRDYETIKNKFRPGHADLTYFKKYGIRDFRGVSAKAFDGRGNYTLGIVDYTIFPEVELDKVQRQLGFDICVVTSANTNDEARELLHLLGMPFRGREKKAA